MEFREISKDSSAHMECRTDVLQIYLYIASIFINLLCNARSENLSLNRRADRLIQIQDDRLAVLEASRQTRSQAGRRADRPTDRLGDRQTDQPAC